MTSSFLSFPSLETPPSGAWSSVRWTIAAVVSFPLVVLSASIGATSGFDIVWLPWLCMFLVPPLVYALGVRSPRAVAVHGCMLLSLFALAWLAYALDKSPYDAGYFVLADLIAFVTVSVGASCDAERRRNSRNLEVTR